MRVNKFSGRLGVSLLILAGSAACGTLTDSPTSPFSASGTSSTVSALASPDVSTFNVESAGTGTDGRGPCRFHLGTGRFDCDNQRSGNLTFSRTVTFFDAAGGVQNAYDGTTTARIKTETSVTGTTTTKDGGTATINRTGLMDVTGLEGAETTRTLNGTENGTINISGTGPGGNAFSINTVLSDATTNLVVPVPASFRNRSFPLSGSRSHSTTTTTTRGSETRTDTVVRKETFDGTAIVQVELTINGVTQNCTVNLERHSTTCKR